MKCKKFFALLLSLCMIMSTFVAVVHAGTENVTVTMSADFDAASDDVVAGPAVTGVAGSTIGDASGVMEVTANAQDTWSGQANTSAWGVVGFAVVDENGAPISRNALAGWDTIEYSVDIMVPDTTKVTSSKLFMRAWKDTDETPKGTNADLVSFAGLENGVWKTFEGTVDVADLRWQQTDSMDLPLYLVIRPNLKEEGAKIYMDDLTLTLTKTVTVEDEEEEEESDEITFSLTRVVNASSHNGNALPAVGEVTGNAFTATLRNIREYTYNRNLSNPSDMGGDCDYQPWVAVNFDNPIDTDDDWYVAFDLTSEGIVNSIGAEYETLTVRPRFYNGNDQVCGHSDHVQTVVANTGDAVKVVVPVNTSLLTGPVTKIGIAVAVGPSVKANEYTDSDAYFTIDNFEVAMGEYGAEDEEPELPPVSPDEPEEDDNVIPHTIQKAHGTQVVTESNGAYTITVADVYDKMTADGTNSYNSFVSVIPETPIPLDAEWTLSYDLTTSGLTTESGDIWLRLLDNTTQAAQGKTLGYVKGTASFADGTVRYTFTSDNFEVGGGTSAATEIVAINLTVGLSRERTAYGEAPFDGSVTFSNITLESGFPSEEEPELPPVTPDEPEDDEEEVVEELSFVLSKAVNARTTNGVAIPGVGALAEDVFTATLREVRLYEEARVEAAPEGTTSIGSGVSYQAWVWVELDEELDTDEDWYVSFDLTSEGILHSLHAEYSDETPLVDTVRFRFYNGNTEVNTNYRPAQTISVNKGEPVSAGCQVDTDMITGPVTKIGLVVNLGSAIQNNEFIDSDAYFSISNVEVAMGEYVAPEVEDPEEPEEPEVPGDDDDDDEITDELIYTAVVDSSNDFETDMGDVLVGTTAVTGEIVDLDGENVLKVTAEGATNHTGLVGIKLVDAEGNAVKITDLEEYDKVTFSVDVMMEDKSALPSNANGAFIALRYGGWTPTSAQASLANLGGSTLTAGQWKTISGSYMVKDIPWQATNFDGDVYFYIRPNFTAAAVMYVDNMSIKVEKEFVPTILEVTEVSTGADSVTINVETDGVIDIDSLADYILIDGAAVNAASVTAEAVDATNTLVTIASLAPNTEYEIAVTGALNSRDRVVAVAEGEGTITVSTIAEVDAEATLSRGEVTYSLTSNLTETETIYVVLLRCKGNTVIETIALPVEIEAGETVEDSIDVPTLGNDEYYRLFAWSYEDGVINSMAGLIDLD